MRGQTSMEYLIACGWAILIVIIVALVLWSFGIFDPDTYINELEEDCHELRGIKNAVGSRFEDHYRYDTCTLIYCDYEIVNNITICNSYQEEIYTIRDGVWLHEQIS